MGERRDLPKTGKCVNHNHPQCCCFPALCSYRDTRRGQPAVVGPGCMLIEPWGWAGAGGETLASCFLLPPPASSSSLPFSPHPIFCLLSFHILPLSSSSPVPLPSSFPSSPAIMGRSPCKELWLLAKMEGEPGTGKDPSKGLYTGPA